MKHSFQFLITLVFVLCLGTSIFAQSHQMYLSAPTSVTYLNKIIMGDTLSTGGRADLQRVYVLQRGGMWFFNGVITNIGWDVRIQAEDGTGALPIIYGICATGSSTVPIDFIDAQGNVTIKNVVVNGYFDLDPAYNSLTYGSPKELIVFNVAGNYSLVVDGCLLLNAYQATLRTFAGIRSIIVTNTTFANSGSAPWKGIGDGRPVDLRNVSCDTLLIVNCTMVNGNDRIVRHIASTARLNNFIFEHNTIINSGGRYGVIAMGLVGAKVKIESNIFVDPMVVGADSSLKRQNDWIEAGETYNMNPDNVANYPIGTIGDAGRVNMSWIYSQLEATPYGTSFSVKNNYWYVTPEIQAVWNQIHAIPLCNPTVNTGSQLTNFIKSKLADPSKAFTKLAITFTKAPKPMAGFAFWALSPSSMGGAAEASSGGTFVNFDKHNATYHRDTMDCSYSTSLAAYTGGVGGFPAGDLRWFPARKTAWAAAGGWNAVELTNTEIPSNFDLAQNYPNPFNPTTKISYSLPKESKVKLEVFDILGRKVITLVDASQTAGKYAVDFDASKYSSGVYIYELITQDYSVSKKMMLMK
jgi:hypothetical protein